MRKHVVVLAWAALLTWPFAVQGQTRTVRLSEPLQSPEPLAADIGLPYLPYLSLSADGNTAVFISARSTLVAGDTNRTGSNFGTDVFIRDVASGVTRRILGVGGAQPNGDATVSRLTRDGRYVFFASKASNLVPNDPNAAFESTFRHDLATGVTTILDIPASVVSVSGNGRYLAYYFGNAKLLDLQTGVTTDFVQGAFPGELFFSFDGRTVAFQAAVVNGVYTGSRSQVFVQNLDTGTYELISRRPDGGPGNDSSYGVAISDDGRYVAFDSMASDLVPSGHQRCTGRVPP